MDTQIMHTDGKANIQNSDVTKAEDLPDAKSFSDAAGVSSMDGIDIDALRAETAKWQERVPKLAMALRERTEELARTRQELRDAQTATAKAVGQVGESDDARLLARDQLIADLQQKLKDLAKRHRSAASELHVSQLDLESAAEEAKSWQEKWHQVTSSLDSSIADATRSSSAWEQVRRKLEEQEHALTREHEDVLERVRRDKESLRVRNSNLQETVEFANKQIESLGEDMMLLVTQGKTAELALNEAEQRNSELATAEAELRQQIKSLEKTVAGHQSNSDEVTAALDTAKQQSDTHKDQIISLEQQLVQQSDESSKVFEQRAKEFQHQLAEENQRYVAAMQAADEEQTQLVRQLDHKDEIAAEIKQQLEVKEQANSTQAKELQTLRKSLDSAKQQLDDALVMHTEVATQAAEESSNAAKQIHALNTALKDAQDHSALSDQNQTAQVAELAMLHEAQNRWLILEQKLLTQANEITETSHQKQQQLEAEVVRLTDCVNQAQQSHEQREDERCRLSEKVCELEEEQNRLKSNLNERSALVRELEQERVRQTESEAESSAEQIQLEQQLDEVQNRCETYQEHAQELEAKQVSQQHLMSELENELSEMKEDSAAALKMVEQDRRDAKEETREVAGQFTLLQERFDDLQAGNGELLEQVDGHVQEITVLQAQIKEYQAEGGKKSTGMVSTAERKQVKELEQLLRERTEEIDNLRWRQEQQQAASEDNVVMILNQQLNDAREENRRLSDKLANANEAPDTKSDEADDLTVLKGVGDKLAAQLATRGFTKLQQIAALEAKALEKEGHALHAFKSRIARDDWIKQAKVLLSS